MYFNAFPSFLSFRAVQCLLTFFVHLMIVTHLSGLPRVFFFVATDIIENTMNFTYTGGSRIRLATKGGKTDRSYDKLQRLM